jgi:small glutamine-rich tetratricopeptide repeat-containing protein alpha
MGVNNAEDALEAYSKAAELEPDNIGYRSAVEQARLKLSKPTSPSPSQSQSQSTGSGRMPPMGGLDLAGLMNNPELMNMASRMMSDPDAMRNMMSNPNLQSMYPTTLYLNS